MKAIFLDYTGTMVREDGDYTKLLIKHFIENSDLKNPKDALAVVWKKVKEKEAKSYKENFKTEDQIVDEIIAECSVKYGLSGDFKKLHENWQKSWIYAPLFDDVKPFFEKCKVPIFVITNDGIQYIEESMKDKGLKPAGIISAEAVYAYKPHKEIFEEALRVAGCEVSEVIHIGDSVVSDVDGARNAGITPVLIDRSGKIQEESAGVKVIRSLMEII